MVVPHETNISTFEYLNISHLLLSHIVDTVDYGTISFISILIYCKLRFKKSYLLLFLKVDLSFYSRSIMSRSIRSSNTRGSK